MPAWYVHMESARETVNRLRDGDIPPGFPIGAPRPETSARSATPGATTSRSGRSGPTCSTCCPTSPTPRADASARSSSGCSTCGDGSTKSSSASGRSGSGRIDQRRPARDPADRWPVQPVRRDPRRAERGGHRRLQGPGRQHGRLVRRADLGVPAGASRTRRSTGRTSSTTGARTSSRSCCSARRGPRSTPRRPMTSASTRRPGWRSPSAG